MLSADLCQIVKMPTNNDKNMCSINVTSYQIWVHPLMVDLHLEIDTLMFSIRYCLEPSFQCSP